MAKFKRKKATIALLLDLVEDLTIELKNALDYIEDQEVVVEDLTQEVEELEFKLAGYDVMSPANAD